MRTNVARATMAPRTHEGGIAAHQKPETELLRTIGSCLLFEGTFYEKGSDIAERIAELSQQVSPNFLAELAVYARTTLNLRHVSLWLAVQLLRHKAILGCGTVYKVIQRADELAEIVSLYWRQNPPQKPPKHKPLAHQLKIGLALAFTKFDEYSLSKYDRAGAIRLRDVLFLCHAKPKDAAQAELWKRLVDNKLTAPDTWEVALSAGQDKRETFERLLHERRIGHLALLRNLRNMEAAGVDRELVINALINGAAKSRALPFQFIAAWRFAPSFAGAIDTAMLRALTENKPLAGSTAIIVDVSGSMDVPLSEKSKLSRLDAAAALAVLVREVAQDCRIFTFSNEVFEVPACRGIALVDAIARSQPHQGTYLAGAVQTIAVRLPKNLTRILVITDEQSHDGGVPAMVGDTRGYLVNVAPYQPGLETSGGWTRINGFSERIVDYVQWEEQGLSESELSKAN